MTWIKQNENSYIHDTAPFSLIKQNEIWYVVDSRDQSKAVPYDDIFNNPVYDVDFSSKSLLAKHFRAEGVNTPGTPGHSFKNEINSGLYRESPGVLAISVLGNKQLSIDSSGSVFTPNVPRFSAKKTNLTGITANNIIPTWVEDFDTGNNFNNSTGVYTIPVSGFYLFFAYAAANDSTTATLRIRKNGVLQASVNGQNVTGFNNFNAPIISIINCSTSDTIDFFTNVSSFVVPTTIPMYFAGGLLG